MCLGTYINELEEKLAKMKFLPNTGNVSLNVTLSAKIALAKAENIEVTVDGYIPDSLIISDVKLSIVISNLLDTAIEACCAIPISPENIVLPERFIRIYIGLKGKMLYFSMWNSLKEKQKKTSPLLATKRKGVNVLRLRRAEKSLKKMGGWIKYNNEEGIFISEFLIPAIE